MGEKIKSSGQTREFSTGAHRDSLVEQKGMPSILPLDVIANVLGEDEVVMHIWEFMRTQEIVHIEHAIAAAIQYGIQGNDWENQYLAMLDVSFHYEDGGKKYGYGNWTYGMPIEVFLDSGLRHYLKWVGGMTDEPHHRATIWNLANLAWTWEHVPEAKKKFAEWLQNTWHN